MRFTGSTVCIDLSGTCADVTGQDGSVTPSCAGANESGSGGPNIVLNVTPVPEPT